ncbi:ANTAR domain-containing response regulator [Blastopirellula marina]|uniref:Response regulator n=1 Tax=Blastopirellula marina TaxID=124 RepID=A0A2S8G247_9BACT|nr:response regulator [Blastopirellula marina]PQO38522.1 response regulator [Blastopirellula marina]PTL45179.1 ANTAR domain-containing protein [Blastopirellula marina]
MKNFRIIFAEDDPVCATFLRRSLQHLGHDVIGETDTGEEVITLCRDRRPDLLLTDIQLRGLNGQQAAEAILDQQILPVILISSHHSETMVERARSNDISAYLVKPIELADLSTTIPIVMQRFQDMQTTKNENARLSQELQNRKLIERAKGILMKRSCLDESVAFNRIRKMARDRRVCLAEIANCIIVSEEALGGV